MRGGGAPGDGRGIIYVRTARGKSADLLDGEQVGVSVTRAFAWPPEDPYTVEQATTLLTDKPRTWPVHRRTSAPSTLAQAGIGVLAYTPGMRAS